MATAKKRKLSGSTDGMPISIQATGTPGDTIHTSVAGTTPGNWDEIWLYAQNNHTSDVLLEVYFGDEDNDYKILVTVPSQVGLVPIIPGLILQNGAVVTAVASVTDKVSVVGFVNTITD